MKPDIKNVISVSGMLSVNMLMTTLTIVISELKNCGIDWLII